MPPRSRSPVDPKPPYSRSQRRSLSPPDHRHPSSYKRARLNPPMLATLPHNAPHFSKHDFKTYRPMLALYLEVQKRLDIEGLAEHEMRGRWKRFVGKWNRGELAEGWYEPKMFEKAEAFVAGNTPAVKMIQHEISGPRPLADATEHSSNEDELGPALPGAISGVAHSIKRSGPSIPNLQDLELQRELSHEDLRDSREQLRDLRRLDRKQQKEHLEDIAPRAEAGSKHRMLEKKRENADSNRLFAAGKTEGGGVEDVPDSDLLGGEDEGIAGYKKQKRETERKKNERELRREEILRARQAEREERVQQYKEKEQRTMSGLVALAKARFG